MHYEYYLIFENKTHFRSISEINSLHDFLMQLQLSCHLFLIRLNSNQCLGICYKHVIDLSINQNIK